MKKILSIFSISAILTSTTISSKGGISCKSKSFSLSSITLGDDIVGLANKSRSIQEAASLTINGQKTYSNVIKDIITQYQKFYNSNLKNSDFITNCVSPTLKHPWALKIKNGIHAAILNSNKVDLQVHFNQPLASNTNSLSVEVTTIDSNVSGLKQVIIPLYFNKYIFTNKDVNNNIGIDNPINNELATSIHLSKTNALDLELYFKVVLNQSVKNYINQWNALSGDNQTIVYNDILNRVNANFDQYMAFENNVVNKVKNFTSVGNNKIVFNKAFKIFSVGSESNEIYLPKSSTSGFGYWSDVYMAIPVFNWSYLTNNNYFSNSDTYVYAFLGETPAYYPPIAF